MKKDKECPDIKDTSKTYPRIKDTSKTYRKVDPSELSEVLGADCSFGHLLIGSKGEEYFELTTSEDNKTVRVCRLMNNELSDCKLICTTEGGFFFSCVYAAKHAESFCRRVYGYQILRSTRGKWRVSFYEKV